jgi:spermidine synthase
VLSVDNGKLEAAEQRRHGSLHFSYEEALRKALAAAGLDHRVQLVTGDAVAYSPQPSSFDLIYHDIPLRLEAGLELFERWWPALAPGGKFVLRDGREPRLPATRALADALRVRGDLVFEAAAPGVFEVIVR